MKSIIFIVFQFTNDFVYLYPLLMTLVWMVGGLIFYRRLEHKRSDPPALDKYPFFSIVIPCHNEEGQISETIQQLMEVDYPHYEIVAVDDGSTDDTASILHDLCKNHKQVRAVYVKENSGKGVALNAGCLIANGEFILTLDADALLDPRALRQIAWHFHAFPRVGAVTGNPRVLNRTTLLAKIQTGEYATIIGLIKRTHRILGKVLTVSGVIAAFRRQALLSVRFWDTDMVTEDIDITWKLEKRFWDIRYEPRAICWIRVPETVKGLWRQRSRWAQGGVEVIRKHCDVWQDWRQRRLWAVYLEYVGSVLWSYTLWSLVLLWLVNVIFNLDLPVEIRPLIPPRWTGAILALACLAQFTVSLYVDCAYEKKMFRYLFWVIWYPFAYWMISSLAVIFAAPRALLKRKGTPAVWSSPDRGIDRL